ncbi:MAG: hypothetical protein ACXW15_03055 [Acidimicrobiia bacterium]
MTDQAQDQDPPAMDTATEPDDLRFEIIGGAGPYEAAAIMAAIDAALTEELAAEAIPSQPAMPGAWFMSGRPQVVLGPRTSFQGLSPTPGADDENGVSEA